MSQNSQPSLTNCHSCNQKSTNPKDTFQPLDSVWRIILLCKKCHKSISSGQTCPYCFKSVSNNFFKCSVCDNNIHFTCVNDFMNSMPWCYFNEFVTCVDCWVPSSRKISVSLCGEIESKRVLDMELAVKFRRIFSCVPKKIKSREFAIDPFDLRVWRILSWGGISYTRRGGSNGDRDSDGLFTYKRDKNRNVVRIDDEEEDGVTVSDEELELGSGDDGGVSCSSGVLESLIRIEAGERDVDFDLSEEQIRSWFKGERFGENIVTYKRRRIASTNVNLFWRGSGKRARVPVSSTDSVLDANRCALNQSPWDFATDFSPPSSPPHFPQYQTGPFVEMVPTTR